MSGLTEPQLDSDQSFVWTEAATSPVVGSHCDRESAGLENRPLCFYKGADSGGCGCGRGRVSPVLVWHYLSSVQYITIQKHAI